MAKRKNQLAEKLGEDQPQGWRDQVRVTDQPTAPQADSSGEGQYKRKTYLITPALEGRIEALAESERVGQDELVRYLLTFALDKIKNGEHTLPTQPRTIYTLLS